MTKEEKEKAIEIAKAKLTEEEIELLGLNKKPRKKRVKKNHKLTINYMIGDANGYTKEEATISLDNPFLKPITDTLDKLKSPKGYWGISMSHNHVIANKKEGNISDKECDLLCLVLGYAMYEKEDIEAIGLEGSEENLKFLEEFDGIFLDETVYSFLSYEGYKLK